MQNENNPKVDSLTIYKNKGETFNCNIAIDGASKDSVEIRLCLEFEDNKNLFFYGNIKEDGTCEIHIPKLKEFDNKEGRLVVEAIADSTYFKLYEAQVNLKNSVEISFSKKNEETEPVQTKIQLNRIVQKTEEEPIVEQKDKPVEQRTGLKSFRDYKKR